MDQKNRALTIYKELYTHFGPQGWWPAKTKFEVAIGAILTQATSWGNVEKAINNLKQEDALSAKAIQAMRSSRLARVIRPSLYYNAKAKKLKCFVKVLCTDYNSNMDDLIRIEQGSLREILLGIWGIGPETADSIVLYAANKPSFVVDGYTLRIFRRVGMLGRDVDYNTAKKFFEDNLPKDVGLFKEYHALIVELGKNYCKVKPDCMACPIRHHCKRAI